MDSSVFDHEHYNKANIMSISDQAVDVTFNAWWKEFGGTYESIPRALERTRQQIGAPNASRILTAASSTSGS